MWATLCIPVVAVVLASAHAAQKGWGGGSEKVLLKDLETITLYNRKMTNARRSQPIPQLTCLGGSAGCNTFQPEVVQCHNRGSDGYDVQWECKTDMDNAYRFGRVEVSCEGYEYPDDPYVLRGSCGLEYTLERTQEGYQKKNVYVNDHRQRDGGSTMGNLVFLVVVAVVIYAVYRTCIASYQNNDHDDTTDRRGDTRRPRQPPQPGFRDDYMPGSDDCHSTYNSGRSYTRNQNTGLGGGGFWTGAATGGLLGYMFGNRGSRTNTYYQQPQTGWGSGWGSSGSSWGSGWGSGGGSSWGSGSSGGFSSGTRTASGFGGTKRR